ncbi:F-box only protein 30a [Megalops cyprinoides]|uniref:F-box only protein 30a n=1 Tax=Megalops cyprinoides TaxID=118141 RepID=UPI001864ED87|nr:F-box only protein 30a [Megalops cyprinoides]
MEEPMEEGHTHCVNCVNRRCMAKPEPGVSCDLIGCPMTCGAIFHSCKADEHCLLCPLERVPCLNSGFGCPFTVARNKIAEHLETCPASVVCCTMEWNRWPIGYADRKSYESLSKDLDVVDQLDMALALQDQRMLLESLKVATMVSQSIYSQVADSAAVPTSVPEEGAANGAVGMDAESYSELYQATVETSRSLAAALDILSSSTKETDMGNRKVMEEKLNRTEVLRDQDEGGLDLENVEMKECEGDADQELGAVGGLDQGVRADPGDQAVGVRSTHTKRNQSDEYPADSVDADSMMALAEGEEKALCNGFHFSGGHQTGQDQDQMDFDQTELMHSETNGPCETRQPEEGPDQDHSIPAEAQEPSGSPLPAAPSPIQASLPDPPPNNGPQQPPADSEDGWPGCKLQNVQVLRGTSAFMVNGRRALLTDSYLFRAKTEDKAVDTSDLEVPDDPMGLHGIDLITAALLFCLGDSPGGRGVSDSRFVDGYRVDFGTQTFSFPSAILATDTMVGDIASASACDHASPQLSNPSPFHTLRLDLVLECVARYQTKQRSMFTFVCGQLFRRDEFSSHFRNVHGDIHAGLNGWMEQRCPLAYYGCTYSQRRFCPSAQGSRVVHDRHLRSFGVRPAAPTLPDEPPRGASSAPPAPAPPGDRLSRLPFEVLQHVARFLDGFSLCQLSRVSRRMREVCASLLQTRGMVVLLWAKRQRPDGTTSWHIKDKVWRFSTAFGTVQEWKFADIASMADHLKRCQFNTVERREEAVPLPCMCFTRELTREGRSLRSVLKPVL